LGEKLLKNKNFYLIILAIVINNLGDIVFDLFITWNITYQTGDIMNAVYLLGSSMLFRAILALFTGIFVDKFNVKKLIIFSNLSSIIIIALFGLCWEFAIQYIVIGIVFILINDINNEIFKRSYINLCAEIFSKETFVRFQAISSIAVRCISIIGSSIAGIVISALPPLFIITLDILTFVLCAVIFGFVKYTYKEKERIIEKQVLSKLKNIFNDVSYTFKKMFHSKYILSFVILMFILNMAYGYIPNILPVSIANNSSSALLGYIKSAMAVGEVIGLILIAKAARYVSLTFKVSMISNLLIMLLLGITHSIYLTIGLFFLYGFADSLTQPLFSYTIAGLDDKDRGKIIGGIDMIIMFSPSLGMYIVTKIMNINQIYGFGILTIIFFIGLLMIMLNKSLNSIKIEY